MANYLGKRILNAVERGDGDTYIAVMRITFPELLKQSQEVVDRNYPHIISPMDT